jgi:hypothetical protein
MLLGPEDPSACLPLFDRRPVQALSEHGARSYHRDGLGPVASISGFYGRPGAQEGRGVAAPTARVVGLSVNFKLGLRRWQRS